MRFVAAIIMLIVALVLFATASPLVTAAPSSPLNAGDRLQYAVAVELQQHHVRSGVHNGDTVTESSAQGTATFNIYSIAQDGTALASVALNLKGTDAGRPVAMQTATPGKVLPDGQLRMQAPVGLGVSDAFAAANTTLAEMFAHQPLLPGKTWTTVANSEFATMTLTRKVLADTNYQGRRALTVQSLGTGSLMRTADGKPTSGSISIGGTTYYDGENHILVGEAFRTLTVVAQPGTSTSHDDYSSTFNVVLDTWDHPSTQPAASAHPAPVEASPEASTQPSPPPTPVPPLYSTPYPTPGPSATS